jgi:hypothetical protein
MNKASVKVPSARTSPATALADRPPAQPAQALHWVPNAPVAFFGIVLGLAGLGNAWRAATAAWQVPAVVGEALMAAATVVWVIVVALYALKWAFLRPQAIAEALHPVQCCFIGLGGVSTMLVALAVLPYNRPVAARHLSARSVLRDIQSICYERAPRISSKSQEGKGASP